MEGIDDMRLIYASYNSNYNSIDITTFGNVLLRIDCNKAEEGIRTTPGSQCALNALLIGVSEGVGKGVGRYRK